MSNTAHTCYGLSSILCYMCRGKVFPEKPGKVAFAQLQDLSVAFICSDHCMQKFSESREVIIEEVQEVPDTIPKISELAKMFSGLDWAQHLVKTSEKQNNNNE